MVGLVYALGAFVIRASLPTTKTRLQLAIAITTILLVEAIDFFRKPFDLTTFTTKAVATIFGMVLAKTALEGTDVIWNGMIRLAGQMLDALGV